MDEMPGGGRAGGGGGYTLRNPCVMEEGKITGFHGLGNLLDVTRIHTHTHTHMHAPSQSIEIYMHAQTQKQTERERMMKGCFSRH